MNPIYFNSQKSKWKWEKIPFSILKIFMNEWKKCFQTKKHEIKWELRNKKDSRHLFNLLYFGRCLLIQTYLSVYFLYCWNSCIDAKTYGARKAHLSCELFYFLCIVVTPALMLKHTMAPAKHNLVVNWLLCIVLNSFVRNFVLFYRERIFL